MAQPFYKVVTHSASAYGGRDGAAARAMFEHQKKLIEQGQTQAHEVVMYSDGAILDHFILNEEEEFQEVEDTPLEKALKIAVFLDAAASPEYLRGISELIANLYPSSAEPDSEEWAGMIRTEITLRINKEQANVK